MILSVTGHRPDKLNNEWNHDGPISKRIASEIVQVFDFYRPEKCICGMALGIDTIFALAVLKHLTCPLIAAIPFEGQEKKWSERSQLAYHEILSHPRTEKVIVSPGGYAAWKMQARNAWMNNQLINTPPFIPANKLLAVWDESEGGTANCVKDAKKKGIEIIHINPKQFF